jgi:hypothetical protein
MNTQTAPVDVERLRALRLEESLRQESADREEDSRELEELELVSELSKTGVRGKDFEVVNTQFGVFGVTKPDARGIAAWDKAVSEKVISPDRLAGILRNYILPTSKAIEFHAIATERPGIVSGPGSLGVAFLSLTGALRFDSKKKY